MADYTPINSGGAIPFTSQASGTITGGQMVMVSGNNTVTVATDAVTTVVGVAAHDATSGKKVAVWPLNNVTHEVIAAGAVTAGDILNVGAVAGTVKAIAAGTFGTKVGKALAGAADTALCRFIGGG